MNRIAESVIGKRCPICLSRIEVRSAAVINPCMHAYCIGCIRRWSDFKRKCPLCNADFGSWFCKINRDFREEKLVPFGRWKTVSSLAPNDALLRRRRAQFFEQRRIIQRSREVPGVQSQAKELPRQRSFGRSSHESPDVIAERIRQWRVSIYEQRLQAVPLPHKNGSLQQVVGNNGAKEMILRRIEPWIQRELQAVLADPDPTIIVHVATSLFISRYEKKHGNFEDQVVPEDEFLAPLRPFLHDWTEIFWHELRCFAESSFSMETYDTVVVYEGVG
ncbi:E3 ubiquitin-protein ligase ICP0 [Sesamum alatum]|uniref:RING-type E3 ubiquitin transferase n=1 Tax=Sesamum alatum TaxID=300844 RepID=A0AAE1YA24_9LAMI|nr:E3 ubiquitin-protein ligase ICP0 [Sesamum alatum]